MQWMTEREARLIDAEEAEAREDDFGVCEETRTEADRLEEGFAMIEEEPPLGGRFFWTR